MSSSCTVEIYEGSFSDGLYQLDVNQQVLSDGKNSIDLAGNVAYLDEIKESYTRKLVKNAFAKDSKSGYILLSCKLKDGSSFKGKITAENKEEQWQTLQEICFLTKNTSSAFDFLAGAPQQNSYPSTVSLTDTIKAAEAASAAEGSEAVKHTDLRISRDKDAAASGSEKSVEELTSGEKTEDDFFHGFTASAFGVPVASEEEEEKTPAPKPEPAQEETEFRISKRPTAKSKSKHKKEKKNKREVAMPQKSAAPAQADEKLIFKDALNLFKEERYSDANQLFLMSANAGFAESYAYLGRIALRGLGCEKDREKAEMHFKKGVKAGCPLCCAELGLIYLQQNEEKQSEKYFNTYFRSNAFEAMSEDTFAVVGKYITERSLRGFSLQFRTELDVVENDDLLTQISYLQSIEKHGGLLHVAAAEKTNNDLKKALVEKLDYNRRNFSGHTPLHSIAFWISEEGQVLAEDEMIKNAKLLIGGGADLNIKDNEGNTALHYAIKNNRYQLAAFLAENGADCSVHSKDGLSPFLQAVLHICRCKEFTRQESQLLEAFVNNEIDINEKCKSFLIEKNVYIGGVSALHIAFSYENTDMARFLIGCGAAPDISDANGVTPLDIALAADAKDLLILLQACGISEQHRPKVEKKWHLKRMEYFRQARSLLLEKAGL
ncbi:MAG: ankyrin repeat domain-containing protein [Planctomycetota bacterium]|jgi:TPR repeat protein